MSLGFVIAFVILAATALFGAWKMITSHHPVHSALYLVLNFAAGAGLYLLLGAPFIAIVQIWVYAGAIMVLFLFIIMYLNIQAVQDVERPGFRRTTALTAAGLMAGLLIAGGAFQWLGSSAAVTSATLREAEQAVASPRTQHVLPSMPAGDPRAAQAMRVARSRGAGGREWRVEEIGIELYSRYTLPFEIASFVILVAMIGVLIIARPELRRERGGAVAVAATQEEAQ